MNKYVHKVKYYETDKMGITHHSNYIRIMEEARLDFLEQIGFGFEKLEATGIVSPVLGIEAKYVKTTTFPDEIEVEVFVEKLSPLKMTIGYDFSVKGETVFTATSSHCFLNMEGRPVFIQKDYPDFFAAMKGMERAKE
ncbi:MAG: acyl-CoA thioesterase [Treponema sp.]|nr:acyl-CoA thioesterase [Treponema sp.]